MRHSRVILVEQILGADGVEHAAEAVVGGGDAEEAQALRVLSLPRARNQHILAARHRLQRDQCLTSLFC